MQLEIYYIMTIWTLLVSFSGRRIFR